MESFYTPAKEGGELGPGEDEAMLSDYVMIVRACIAIIAAIRVVATLVQS